MRNPKKNLVELLLTRLPTVSKRLIAQCVGYCRTSPYYQPTKADTDLALYHQLIDTLASHPSYGHRRLAIALNVGRKRVRRVMKLFALKPYKRLARHRKRRDERREPEQHPNLIKGLCPRVPNFAWVCDFTYIKWKHQYIYLATVMDLLTREIVGHQMSTKHTSTLVTAALADALITRKLTKPKIIHSDQGSEYCAQDYIRFAEDWGIQISMSKKASPWENGYQESFFNNFKTDLGLEFNRFDTLGELVEAIHQTIHYYNQTRIHTSLKTTPNNYYKQKIHSETLSKKRGT